MKLPKISKRENITRAVGMLLLLAAVIAVPVVGLLAEKGSYREYESTVLQYAQTYGVSPALVFSVMETESSFRPDEVSHAGAKGLMQITPETFVWLQTKTGEALGEEMLLDSETSIKYGTFFLSILLREFNNTDTALAAYNAGMNAVAGWLKNPDYSDDGETLKEIPFSETAYYVKKVNKAFKKYQELYK